jgi:hypothetical protein
MVSRMHGHGFATLALAEAYGMAPRNERLKQALTAAVGVIERSQSPEGGWYYFPHPVNHEGSVTVCPGPGAAGRARRGRAGRPGGHRARRGLRPRAAQRVGALPL